MNFKMGNTLVSPWIFLSWLASSLLHLGSQGNLILQTTRTSSSLWERSLGFSSEVRARTCVHRRRHTLLDSLFLSSPFHLLVSFEGSGYLASGNI